MTRECTINTLVEFARYMVQGSTISRELNGRNIMNCDLSDEKEFMAGPPYSGPDRSPNISVLPDIQILVI